MPGTVDLLSPEGKLVTVPADQEAAYTAPGRDFKRIGAEARADRVGAAAQEANTSAVNTFARNVLDVPTLGGVSAAQRALGGEDARIRMQQEEDSHGKAALAGGIVGSVLPWGAASRAAKAVAGAVELGEGAGIAAHVAKGALVGGVEGGVLGAGQGVHELSLSDDPVTLESAAAALSSNMLYGAAIGGAAGGVTKLAEKGLARAKLALDAAGAKAAAAEAVPADLAQLDAKGLKAARQAELDGLEAARSPQRTQLADDIAEFRAGAKEDKAYLATKGEDAKAIGNVKEVGKISLDADRRLDRILNNPVRLAERPQIALEALQQQEHALTQLVKNGPELRAAFAADETGARAAALDSAAKHLDQNLALQERIRAITAPHASERLAAIDNATEALRAPKPEASLPEKMLGGSSYGAIAGAVGAVPVVGPLLAHVAAAKGSKMVTDLVFGRLANATGEAAKKTSAALGAFLDTSQKLAPHIPVLATKVLQKQRYAPEGTVPPEPELAGGSPLAKAYKARSAEIRSQTVYDETGVPRMRPEARAAMADRLSAIRIQDPRAADGIETLAARRIEFLASKIPRRPDFGGIQAGPDRWQPSDYDMRTFARFSAAAEDPGAIEHRLASGSITPEDAEAYHAIYPERAEAFKQQVLAGLPTLQKTLPYAKRLALSIFTGVAVDPAMTPEVLSVLQGSFSPQASDMFTPPTAQPQFGSVKKSVPEPTPAQARNG